MIPKYAYAVDDSVVEFFSARPSREREELLHIFRTLALALNPRGDWVQRTATGRELQVKRFGKWLVTFWRDEPVLEVRIVDVKKVLR